MYFSLVARPGGRLLALGQRRADRVQARHERPVLAEHVERALAHAGHDPHAHRHVGRVRELDADLGDRRAERAHAERHHVHGPAAHRALELVLEHDPHVRGVLPVVVRAGVLGLAAEQMNVRSSTRATSPGSLRARYEFGRLASESFSNVPASTSSWHSASYSSAEPSHQWTADACVSSATSSTQARSFLCLVGTVVSMVTWAFDLSRALAVFARALQTVAGNERPNRRPRVRMRQNDHSAEPKLT